jgi:hypothetical protein
VPEYLIRLTAGGGSWPAIPQSRLLNVLEPRGYGSVRVDGLGDLRLVLGGCEMVFSGEDVGWQVWFEGDTVGHDTDALVSQVAQQIQEFAGEHIEWIRLD